MRAIERDGNAIHRTPVPGTDELHLWQFLLEPTPRHWLVLTDDETARANRFALDRPRTQFVAARGTVRERLASYRGCPPRDVPLAVEPDGKPVLADGGLAFNLTHSGERGLLAVANRRVGVDLEALRPMPNAGGLVERFFGPEERAQFAALPEELQLAGFFRGWTCKEALLKAVGTGIQNVDKCVVDLDPRRAPAVVRFDHAALVGTWQLAAWEPVPGYVAALAIEASESVTIVK